MTPPPTLGPATAYERDADGNVIEVVPGTSTPVDDPVTVADVLTVSYVVIPFVLVAALVGYYLGRRRRREIVDEAAVETYAEFVARQTSEDRRASKTLPPTVTLSDAYAHAAATGLGIEEAAAQLFTDRARALIERDLRISRRERRRRDAQEGTP